MGLPCYATLLPLIVLKVGTVCGRELEIVITHGMETLVFWPTSDGFLLRSAEMPGGLGEELVG